MTRRGLLVILSSPSGAGKSTLAGMLRDWDSTLSFSVSATTRAPREGEVDGKDYFFVDVDTFTGQVDRGEMLEHAQVFENYYGSPVAPVEAAINEGRDVLFDIDWQGAQQIAKSALRDHVLSIFILPPSIPELHRRLISRGKDDPGVIERRMQKSWDEISHWDVYDYVLINDKVEETAERLKNIISAERLRAKQQPDLMKRILTLKEEFESRS